MALAKVAVSRRRVFVSPHVLYIRYTPVLYQNGYTRNHANNGSQ